MELRVEPEPSPEERSAIVAALEQIGVGAPEPRTAWSALDLDDEPTQPDRA